MNIKIEYIKDDDGIKHLVIKYQSQHKISTTYFPDLTPQDIVDIATEMLDYGTTHGGSVDTGFLKELIPEDTSPKPNW